MKTIIILVCSDFEWVEVLNHFKDEKLEESPYGDWFIHNPTQNKNNPQVIWFKSGWGKIGSAGATQYVIDRWKPNLIINIGTCGGFEGKIEKDQIVLINKTVVYDMIDLFGESGNSIEKFKMTLDLSWLKDESIKNLPKATMVTADQDIAPERILELNTKYGAIVGDWESGAIAWVAAKNKKKLLIIRGVSDVVGINGNEAYTEDETIILEGVKSVMKILFEIVEKFIGDIE